jgi:hypothetical protein
MTRASLSARRSLAAKSAAVQPLTGMAAAPSSVPPPSADPAPEGFGHEHEARARSEAHRIGERNRMEFS